jgi:hypothetical protein
MWAPRRYREGEGEEGHEAVRRRKKCTRPSGGRRGLEAIRRWEEGSRPTTVGRTGVAWRLREKLEEEDRKRVEETQRVMR